MLRAGVGRSDITPPVGIPMAGFAGRAFPAVAIHDPLTARAVVFDDGSGRVGMVACDIVNVPADVVAQVRQQASEKIGLPPEAILVAGTHTHSGPAYRGDGDIQRGYWASVPERVAEALVAAAAALEPVCIGAASGWSGMGINRRQASGETVELGEDPYRVFDTELGLVRLERPDNRPLAALINYACHAVCLMYDSCLISADYPGYARYFLEQQLGGDATALFFNGAAGDVDPREVFRGPGDPIGSLRHAERAGRLIAREAERVWRRVTLQEEAAVSFLRRGISLPVNPARAIAAAERRVRQAERRAASGGREPTTPYTIWADASPDPEEARQRLEHVKETAAQPIECEIQAVAVGEIAFIGLPGEVFCELGMEIKQRSPFRPTYVIGYANGSIGYVPTPEAFAEGGYEVETATGKADNAGTVLVREALDLLQALKRS